MQLIPTEPETYIKRQLDDMNFEERMKLAKFLDENEYHLSDLVDSFDKLNDEKTQALLGQVDAEKQAEYLRDVIKSAQEKLEVIYG